MAKNGTKAMPSSAQRPSTPFSSARRQSRPKEFCTHTTGAISRASRTCSARTLDSPRCRTSPASRSSASAPKCSATESQSGPLRRRLTTSRQSRPSWRRFSSTWPRSSSGRAMVSHSPDGARPGPTLLTTVTAGPRQEASARLINSLAERSGEK